MLRVVDRRKAVLGGIAGAIAMEAALQLVSLAGFPSFDLVSALGLVIFPKYQLLGWASGLLAHTGIGIFWAVFYAYFFWARLKWPPPLQGLAFALIPTALALLIVYPQLKLMQLDRQTVEVTLQGLYASVSPREVVGLVFSHAVFGLVLGSIYKRPVGYPADRTYRPPAPIRLGTAPSDARNSNGCGFMFATGIECSYPTVDNGRWRIDEMESSGHYRHWPEDFELARQIGVTHIRYGPPLHLVFQGPGRYDWSLVDEPMADLEKHGPEPIADLCHFGVPTWLGNFQNEEIAHVLPEYAAAFADRYPWVRLYTPINEMYVCARNSTIDGLWNEQRSDEAAFVNAVFNLAHASIGMTDSILQRRKDAIFINSESSEFSQPCCPDPKVERISEFENERRFLPLDLIYAHKMSDRMCDYLHDHGVTDESLQKFGHREVPRRSILGVDYYEWNEHLIDMDGRPLSLGELFGWYTIATQYYRRYKMTMMHTETNQANAGDASRWLWRQWHNVQLARRDGIPLVGFTWYSLTDQTDWNNGLQEPIGIIFPVGLLDLNRDPREVGLSYKHLIDMYRDLPEYREARGLKALMS